MWLNGVARGRPEERKGPSIEGFGFAGATVLVEERTEIVENDGIFADGQRLPIEQLRRRVAFARHGVRGEVIQTFGDHGMLRAIGIGPRLNRGAPQCFRFTVGVTQGGKRREVVGSGAAHLRGERRAKREEGSQHLFRFARPALHSP